MNLNLGLNCVAAGLLGLAAMSCAKSGATATRPASNTKSALVRTVQVARAEQRLMERKVRVTGSLAALDRATLANKVAGRLEEIPVDLGSPVRQSQVVAQVGRRDYELLVQQASAALAQARTGLGLPAEGTNDTVDITNISLVREARAVFEEAAQNRLRTLELAESKIASDAQVDTVNASFAVASNRLNKAFEDARTRQATLNQRRVELEIAQQQLTDTAVKAPFDGTVKDRLVSMGEFVAAGTPLITLIRSGVLRLRLEVPEREAVGIHLGQTVRFHVEGETNLHQARLMRVSPSISEDTRMLAVEADVPGHPELRPGAFARAEIILQDNDSALAVPRDALIQFAGLEKVVAIREGKAMELNVVTGRQGPDWIEITSGLEAGEMVVLQPGGLRTGEAVVVAGTPSGPARSDAR
jgi:RND family efflux transporter MFP subunit